MKISDYIVEYLIKKGITDVFGYPGGMVTHLMESFRKYEGQISAHVTYHEQAAAFAACGYAQVSGKPGIAYATSGPGATNLITGICNAYFDSIPAVFITGQVNTEESRTGYSVRQRGFQETDIVSMVKPVTKYAAYVESAQNIKYHLDQAFFAATDGRMGPALLDIPMDIFRSDIDVFDLKGIETKTIQTEPLEKYIYLLQNELDSSKYPCMIVGNGVKLSHHEPEICEIAHKLGIPIVTSMIAFDVLQDDEINYGFIGAYGDRTANFIVAKSDLVISVGSRLDVRQVGGRREDFAPTARIVRFDVDAGELDYHIRGNEISICLDMSDTVSVLKAVRCRKDFTHWISNCNWIKNILKDFDNSKTGKLVSKISEYIPKDTIITTDVGQNQVWVAQSFKLKEGQKVLFSGGHGAMGYSLPAAIGTCYANKKKPTYCFNGDGGLQMNIQELQFLKRENLPVKIIVLNNNALGMIRHFQEMYFDSKYYQTKPSGGYTAPGFAKIANAYGIQSIQVDTSNVEKVKDLFMTNTPALIEILIDEDTHVFPKLEFGKPNQDQEPLLDRALYEEIMRKV